jgi:large subunit ribosomal protein L25
VYGIHSSTPVTIDPKALEKILSSSAGSNAVFQLKVQGEETMDRPVLVKSLERDPMKDFIVHADFLEIRMDQKIKVAVPFSFVGESKGVKMGGLLSVLMRELEVECLPNAIPDEIEIDISEVDLNDVIHVRDVRMPADVDLATEPEDPIVTVVTPVEEEEAVPELAEGEEAAVAAEGEEGAAPAGDAAASSDDSGKEEKEG